MEKVDVNRFSGHVEVSDLDELLQSAYKELHSVETALVKVYDNFFCAMDSKKIILMTLLDLSTAFNTVDHTIMMNILERCYDEASSALEWVISYFSNQHQFVSINRANSKKHLLPYGVPQGSLFGPVGTIAYKHNISYHLHAADDTQLYMWCSNK